MSEYLELARKYLAIAESGDSKRDAYKAAAEAIAAHKAETGESNVVVATTIHKSEGEVRRLLKWRESGYKADSPYLMDTNATSRAAKSHTKKVLRDPVKREEVMEALSDDERAKIIESAAKKSGPKVRKAVESAEEREARERFKRSREAADQRRKPTPLSAFYNSMSSKMAQWSQDLRAVRSVGLDTLALNQVPRMIEAHEILIKEAQENVRVLKGEEPLKDSDVIDVEARVIDIRRELKA